MELTRNKKILEFTRELFSEVLSNSVANKFVGYDSIYAANPWFTQDSVEFMLKYWVESLSDENIENWLNKYDFGNKEKQPTVALIFAGNIPFVGLHDLLCCLVCNTRIKLKLSSKDKLLPEWYISCLKSEFIDLNSSIEITDNIIKDFDAVIATGSNNSKRYFDYYFSKFTNIIRKNRNSIAIITGNETNEQIEAIADDVFIYFGLGCRSVSMLMVPQNYDFSKLIDVFYNKYSNLINHHKYANNYDYYRALFMMNRTEFKDCGFFILRESDILNSPMSVLNYKFYNQIEDVWNFVEANDMNLQAVVSIIDNYKFIKPGNSQKPKLNDYSDGIDTIKFLLNL